MENSHGLGVVSVKAGISAGGDVGWYALTVSRFGKVVASRRSEIPLPVRAD